MSDILLAQGHCASWEIEHIFLTQIFFGGGQPRSIRDRGTMLHQILGAHTLRANAPKVCVWCQVHCLI